jgi:hypothetical protein
MDNLSLKGCSIMGILYSSNSIRRGERGVGHHYRMEMVWNSISKLRLSPRGQNYQCRDLVRSGTNGTVIHHGHPWIKK